MSDPRSAAGSTERQALYQTYVEFKGWEEENSAVAPEDFAALMAVANKPLSGSLLDIGFGRGELLDWARAQGLETCGVELIPELVDRASARGHQASTDLATFAAHRFDVVTAIDVLEHLELAECVDLLRKTAELLKPDGVVIARFPNGQSPFAGAYQHGDLTHVRFLTPGAVRQIAARAGLELCRAANVRPIPPGLRGLKRRAGYLLRDIFETALGTAYLGYRVPMDANIAVVLRKSGT